MTNQDFGEQLNNSEKGEETDNQTPVGEPVAAVGPSNETTVQPTLMNETMPYDAPVTETVSHETSVVTNPESSTTLFNHEESGHFRARWSEIQGLFVDEPRSAVEQADALVSEVIEQFTQKLVSGHNVLNGQWNQGIEPSTEDLRKALQRYRSFFNRLVV